MRIGFYNPYFDTLGGGERYILSIASHLSAKHAVEVFWHDPALLEKAAQRYNLDLAGANVVRNFFIEDPLFTKIRKSSQYDLIFFFTDGSIPVSLAKKNILMFEVPFQNLHIPFYKTLLFTNIVCISKFTQSHLPDNIKNNSLIIYPPVDVGSFKPGRKEKIILSVGRFGSHPTKKHDILINAFRSLHKNIPGFKLVIAGGLHASDMKHFNDLQKTAHGLSVDFYPNISFKDLQDLYAKSPVYWHAAGFGETNPEYMEHFGITPIEAMSAGSVPVAFRGGGLVEIIQNGTDGFLWDTPDELIAKTTELIHNPGLMESFKDKAIGKSKKFNQDKFNTAIDMLMHTLDNT